MTVCTGTRDRLHEAIVFNEGKWECPLCEALADVDHLAGELERLRSILDDRGIRPEGG